MKRILAVFLILTTILLFPTSLFAEEEEVSKDQLTAMVSVNYDYNQYVTSTFYQYQAELANAQKVLENKKATQEDVDAACTALQAAIDALIPLYDKSALLTYAEGLNKYLYDLTLDLPDSTVTEITELMREFESMYKTGDITEDYLLQAANRYDTLIKKVGEADKIGSFSTDDPSVILPSAKPPEKTGGSLTDIRTVMVILGGGVALIALIFVIIYLIPTKQRKKPENQ